MASAIKWARDGANASLLRLQKIEAANEFAAFVDRLISGNRLIFLNCNRAALQVQFILLNLTLLHYLILIYYSYFHYYIMTIMLILSQLSSFVLSFIHVH